MTVAELLTDSFDRIHGVVHAVVDGLSAEDLAARLDPQANSIAWLVWHLTRVQDDHVAALADAKQVWHTGGWVEQFALPFDGDAIGYGQSSIDVGEVRPSSPEVLLGYHDAVHEATCEFVANLGDRDLERVVDDKWDPPVTMGVRLISVVSDDLQHAGQAAFIRGILERARA